MSGTWKDDLLLQTRGSRRGVRGRSAWAWRAVLPMFGDNFEATTVKLSVTKEFKLSFGPKTEQTEATQAEAIAQQPRCFRNRFVQ